MPRLLDQVRQAIRLRHLSYRTEQSYVSWVKRYVHFSGLKHPRELGAPAVTAFLNHLANDRDVAASTQTQALSALLFLYDAVLDRPLGDLDGLVRVRKPPRLPEVLTRSEAAAVLSRLRGPNRLIGGLLYGAGLRLSGALRLRVKDLDVDEGIVRVRQGKGQKDRVTVFPQRLVEPLGRHLADVKVRHQADLAAGFGAVRLPHALAEKYPAAETEWGWQFVFPASRRSEDPRTGRTHRHHRSASAVQKDVRRAAREVGIVKRVGAHTFRHSFATHLLEDGYDVRTVQELLGHAHLRTTQVYLHVLNRPGRGIRSPFDSL